MSDAILIYGRASHFDDFFILEPAREQVLRFKEAWSASRSYSTCDE